MPDKTKWVNEWKQKAENDLRTAQIVLSSEDPLGSDPGTVEYADIQKAIDD